jgi:hypothetical protein
MLTMLLPWRLGRGAMWLSSHAGDGAAEATWSRRDVDADDVAAVTAWSRHDVNAESC